MSDTTTLTPQQRAERMALASKGILVEKLKDAADWQRAVALADTRTPGTRIVISDEAGAVLNAEQAITLSKGLRALAKAKKEVLDIPTRIRNAINEVVTPLEAKVQKVLDEANAAKVAWDREQERRRAVAEREAREAAERERIAEQQRAEEEGAEDNFIPLDAPAPPPPPSKVINTSVGAQVTRRVLTCELVDIHDVDPSWVELKKTPACDAFRDQLAHRDVEEPGIGPENGKVYRGVRFFYLASVQNRVR